MELPGGAGPRGLSPLVITLGGGEAGSVPVAGATSGTGTRNCVTTFNLVS